MRLDAECQSMNVYEAPTKSCTKIVLVDSSKQGPNINQNLKVSDSLSGIRAGLVPGFVLVWWVILLVNAEPIVRNAPNQT
ncbi:hypothetical protein TcWFU_008808 [Taenia crassiceps]|uniref:Uncharacterized protein n=1 Tax=Taenia crassiceps TaxID=6207 RepID=A0ABR4QEP1_9CEST